MSVSFKRNPFKLPHRTRQQEFIWHRTRPLLIIVVIVVLVGYQFYPFSCSPPAAPHKDDASYDEGQLKEIARLMDQIYTTLADLTFIPESAIRRGPHRINTTALSCEVGATTRRLIELLPYVDSFSVQQADWFYGGHFVDYRRREHLEAACDLLRQHELEGTRDMSHFTIPLTIWAVAENDPTSSHTNFHISYARMLLYDTNRHALRISVGKAKNFSLGTEPWMYGLDARDDGIFGQVIQTAGYDLEDDNFDHVPRFHAPTLLERINSAYRDALLSPWETSNHRAEYGVEPAMIKLLMRKNGWPDNFSSAQFRADFIRQQHSPSGWGYAESVNNQIDLLEGNIDRITKLQNINAIQESFDRYLELLSLVSPNDDIENQWLHDLRIQKENVNYRWLTQLLAALRTDRRLLCKGSPCMTNDEFVLWEFRSIERQYLDAQLMKDATIATRCVPDYMPEGKGKLPFDQTDCIERIEVEYHWLFLAYSQSMDDALKQCRRTGRKLLPPNTLGSRAADRLVHLEREIRRNEIMVESLRKWSENLPKDLSRVWAQYAVEMETINSELVISRREISDIKELLKDGTNQERLWWLVRGKPSTVEDI